MAVSNSPRQGLSPGAGDVATAVKPLGLAAELDAFKSEQQQSQGRNSYSAEENRIAISRPDGVRKQSAGAGANDTIGKRNNKRVQPGKLFATNPADQVPVQKLKAKEGRVDHLKPVACAEGRTNSIIANETYRFQRNTTKPAKEAGGSLKGELRLGSQMQEGLQRGKA